VRISKLSAVTISAVRGIARGAGSEFALATDIRFASREESHPGPDGSRLRGGAWRRGRWPPASAGRARACLRNSPRRSRFQRRDTAERYGYVNRAIPDTEFVAFVDDYARRVSRWDHRALGEIKAFINKYTRLPDDEYPLHSDAFWGAVATPGFQSVTKALFDGGLQQKSTLEYHLGADIADVTSAIPS